MPTGMTEDPRHLLLPLDDYFDPPLVTRGRTLATEGHADIESMKTSQGKIRIMSHCCGSRGKQYQQDIQLANDGRRITHVTGICSCNEGFNCAHVAATLIHWQNQTRPHASQTTSISPDEIQAASAETLAWLQVLEKGDQPAPTVKTTNGQQIHYLLHATDARLSLCKTRFLKDGSQGKPEPLRPDLHQLTWGNVPSWFQPDDMPILRLFLALQENVMFVHESSQSLKGEEGAQLLRMALRTERLHLDSMEQPMLRQGTVLKARLVWQRNEEGRQVLRIVSAQQNASLSTDDWVLLPTWPAWAVNTADHTLCLVQFDLPDELVRRLLEAPPLDEIDALLVRLRLGEIGVQQHLDLPLPEAAAPEQPAGKPHAILRLQTVRFNMLPPLRSEEKMAAATLWFQYPGLERSPGIESPLLCCVSSVRVSH